MDQVLNIDIEFRKIAGGEIGICKFICDSERVRLTKYKRNKGSIVPRIIIKRNYNAR